MAEINKQTTTAGVAVWGIGAHAVNSVLPAIMECPDVHLIGILGRDRRKLAHQSDLYGCKAWQSPQDMLACDAVDVVYLATPTALHVEHGRQVLQSGKHLWCEKPLTTNRKDTDSLINLALDRGLCLAVVCGPRYHPHFFAVRTQMESGIIGNNLSLTAGFKFPHMAPDNFRYNPDLGGGALLDQGFYLLTVIDALAPGSLMTISCQVAVESGYQVDTSGKAQLKFDDGTIAELAWGYGFEYQNSLIIEGDKGQLTASPFFSKPANLPPFVTVKAAGIKENRIEIERVNQFVEMMAEFNTALSLPDKRQSMLKAAQRSQILIEIALKSSQNQGEVLAVS